MRSALVLNIILRYWPRVTPNKIFPMQENVGILLADFYLLAPGIVKVNNFRVSRENQAS